jgi:hypothetical protein
LLLLSKIGGFLFLNLFIKERNRYKKHLKAVAPERGILTTDDIWGAKKIPNRAVWDNYLFSLSAT